MMMGSTHQTIYMPQVQSFATPIPPIPEQKQIVEFLDKATAGIDTVARKTLTMVEVLREYRTARNLRRRHRQDRRAGGSRLMAIYEITADQIRKIPETTFSLAGLRERYDLQRLLRKHFDVISPDTLIIAEEFGDWKHDKGPPKRQRLRISVDEDG